MRGKALRVAAGKLGVVLAFGEEPLFRVGDTVRVLNRSPIGHYRVPRYLRGKDAVVESVIEPRAVDNEEEAYGRNAGSKRYRCVYDGVDGLLRCISPQKSGSIAKCVTWSFVRRSN